MTTPPARPPRGQGRHDGRPGPSLVLLVLAATVLVVALAVEALPLWRDWRRPEPSTVDRVTAWESRLAAEELIDSSAELLDLEMHAGPAATSAVLTCALPDGGTGHAFELRGLEVVEQQFEDAEIDRWVTLVSAHWTSLGLTAVPRSVGSVRGFTTITSDGAVVVFLAGPSGAGFHGTTRCASSEGTAPSPDSDPTS